jgi:SRSO17 transposase
VLTTEDHAVTADPSIDPAQWRATFDGLMAAIAGRFVRVEPRRAARDLVLGLLSAVERKNCWWLAEHAGHTGPQAIQRLLRTAVWDPDALRDDVREFVVARLGHPDAVLIPDETGFLKKGIRSVGVQRQYSGTAGRIENSQVAVFLSYASPLGRALIDRRIYLPRSWTDDPQRCAAAGIPDRVAFATKPELALDMITAAVTASTGAAWVASDELYGDNRAFRDGVQILGLGYVLAVSRDHLIPLDGGKARVRADRLAAELSDTAWHRYSAGTGSKGPRWYDWAWIDMATPTQPGHSALIRRNPTTGELAFYHCWTPTPVPLTTLVRVAGMRWAVEEGFQAGKGQVGLDHYQVRIWTAWHRFITLAMLALAFLMVCAAAATPPPTPADPYHHAHDNGPIPLTAAEIRRLFNTLIINPLRARVLTPIQQLLHAQAWSDWRRRHQGRARSAHYQRRLTTDFWP